jgi:eukaryotic-like serine/threonine-protein kinase
MSGQKIHKCQDVVGDRYEIIQFIGEGGMQEVYEAKDLVLTRNVALKVPKNPSAIKRFKRSAVLSAKVNHPNVAKTLDYLESDENYYLIEELISGTNLKEGLLQAAKILDPYLVAKIFHYLAKGISASHHANVFHRDLKPDNVMIVGSFNLLQIKITDFGIAKMAEAEISMALTDENRTLASSTAVGAIPYMAPEMFDRDQSPDCPADIGLTH